MRALPRGLPRKTGGEGEIRTRESRKTYGFQEVRCVDADAHGCQPERAEGFDHAQWTAPPNTPQRLS
jgi:hypothetical protein